MSLKVYLHFEEAGAPEKTSKLSIPKSWVPKKTVADVIELFTGAYNKVNPENCLDKDAVHLATKEKVKIFSNVIIDTVLEDRYDYFIKHGAHVKVAVVATNNNEGKIRCKNYGCSQYFVEGENADDHACSHHTGPPIFHDAAKYWSCCPQRKVYDWEDFQKLVGCVNSCHSTVDPKVSLGDAHASDEADDLPAPPALKSISSYNDTNPEAATAAASAVKTLTSTERKSTRNEDGTAKCKNKGCGKIFNYTDDNHETACCYHAGQPVFHDAIKYWSCCADKKCYDFDSFMVVPGCVKGLHDDGVVDLPPAPTASSSSS